MKIAKSFAMAVVSIAVLLTMAQAAERNQANITLGSAAQVNSQQLKAGDYRVRWSGTGQSAQVEILKGSKVVATSAAEVVPQNTPADHNQVIFEVQNNGARKIQQINVAKEKVSLVFHDGNQSGSGQ